MSTAVNTPARRMVLEVEDVRTRFHARDGAVHAVNGVSSDLRTLQTLDGARPERLESIAGPPPSLPPVACPFAPRRRRENPALRPVAEGHEVACWLDDGAGSHHELSRS